MTVTASTAATFADIDPADHTTETLTAEALRRFAEADRALAAGLTPGLPTFRPDDSHNGPVLDQDQALLYAAHTREQASTLALIALAKS